MAHILDRSAFIITSDGTVNHNYDGSTGENHISIIFKTQRLNVTIRPSGDIAHTSLLQLSADKTKN